MDGKAEAQTSSPFLFITVFPSESNDWTSIPSPRHCNSPRWTGRIGFPRAKQEMISVPPEMEES